MKKNILTVLLILLLTTPLFALSRDNGKVEADIKAGFIINPSLKTDSGTTDMDMTFSIGTDFYYYAIKSIGMGLGANNIFGAKVKNGGSDAKYEFSNLYFALKPKISFSDYNVYYIGQIGYGLIRATDFAGTIENGMYFGIGVGVEYESFIFEILYSSNNGKIKSGSDSSDITYSTLALNMGYRFHY